MNKHFPARMRSGVLIAAVSVLLQSCLSTPEKPYYVSYADDRAIQYEIEKTRKVLSDHPVEALARARALVDNSSGYSDVESLYSEASRKVRSELDLAVESGRWSDAIRYYRSLAALGMKSDAWTESQLINGRNQSWKNEGNRTLSELDAPLASTPEDDAPSSEVVSRMIKGTVTVWVDQGLKIESGVGYANRVIGSAFYIDQRGYLITNYHVISSEVDPSYEGYSRLYVKTPQDPDLRIPARVIGWDPVLDLALLKVEIDPPAIFSLGSSAGLKTGHRIYAIGSPAGLEQTLTSGIVSALNRRLLSLGSVLQIDAPINQGNSGGPIVDEAGLVQAVVFAGIETYEGLNFAIPVEYLRVILPVLYEGGKVSHSWFGVYGKSIALPGTSAPGGVSVVYSVPGSPAEIAGIPQGAVVTALNGQPVKNLEDLQYALIRERPGTIVRVTGIPALTGELEQEYRDWFVMVDKRPERPGSLIFERDIESRALLPIMGLDLERVGNSKKYMVRSVVRGSVADESGFSEQDVVEIRNLDVQHKDGYVALQLYTKRRKSGYLDAFIGLSASLDSPSYF